MWPLQKFRCKAAMEGDIVSSNTVLRKGPILWGLETTCMFDLGERATEQ